MLRAAAIWLRSISCLCRWSRYADALLVRYAVLNPEPFQSAYLHGTALPMLRSSICLAERHLAAALEDANQHKPSYVIYTDDATHESVRLLLLQEFGTEIMYVNMYKCIFFIFEASPQIPSPPSQEVT